MIELNTEQIYSLLDLINADYDKGELSRHFQLIRCLNNSHIDKNISNAFIDIYTGVWHCKSCGMSQHILKTVRKKTHLKFIEILNYLGIEQNNHHAKLYYNQHNNLNNKEIKKDKVSSRLEYKSEKFDPKDYKYTLQKGYTKEYCKEMGIERVPNYYYKDYMKIPINFGGSKCYEFRKLARYEYLYNNVFPNSTDKSKLEEMLEDECNNHNIKYRKGQVFCMENPYQDDDLLYLLKPKVLYSKNSDIKNKLYNFKNLDFNSDLILFEGTASHPKVYQYITKNCTSSFGTIISENQLDLLSSFKKRIIVITDNDDASYIMIGDLNEELNNVFVFNTKTDDKDRDFVDKIKNAEVLSAYKFLDSLF